MAGVSNETCGISQRYSAISQEATTKCCAESHRPNPLWNSRSRSAHDEVAPRLSKLQMQEIMFVKLVGVWVRRLNVAGIVHQLVAIRPLNTDGEQPIGSVAQVECLQNGPFGAFDVQANVMDDRRRAMIGQEVVQGNCLLFNWRLRRADPSLLSQVFVHLRNAASRHGPGDVGKGHILSRPVPEASIVGSAMARSHERMIILLYRLHTDAAPPEFHLEHVSGALTAAGTSARIDEVAAPQSRKHRFNHPAVISETMEVLHTSAVTDTAACCPMLRCANKQNVSAED
jgi:hypothetical protein